MRRKRDFEARGDRSQRGGGGGGGGGGPRRSNYGPKPGGGRHQPFRGGQRDRGPQACPMCGAVVADLSGHMRQKHDDAASHPRE